MRKFLTAAVAALGMAFAAPAAVEAAAHGWKPAGPIKMLIAFRAGGEGLPLAVAGAAVAWCGELDGTRGAGRRRAVAWSLPARLGGRGVGRSRE